VYRYWVVVQTYWDKRVRKVRHKVVHNLGLLGPEEVRRIRMVLALGERPGESIAARVEEIKIGQVYEYGVAVVLDRLWRMWGLGEVCETGLIGKVSGGAMAKILALNRAMAPRSNRLVCTWYEETILLRVLGVPAELVNPSRIYRTLGRLIKKEEALQQQVAARVEELGWDTLSESHGLVQQMNCPVIAATVITCGKLIPHQSDLTHSS